MKKEYLKRDELLLVSLMLFSLFFGAGNLIFPPYLGQEAGSNTYLALLGFFITAVGFPILGVIVVSKFGGLYNLGKKINKKFAIIFTTLIYLSIGPLLGIPRAGSLPYEMTVAPLLHQDFEFHRLALFIYTVIFFGVAYWLCLTPSKLVDRMGKILTPSLLFLIGIVFVGSFFKPLGARGVPSFEYNENPVTTGFLNGYLTMDTIAGLNFGLVIYNVIKSNGIKNDKYIIKNTMKAGKNAGGLLIIVYSILAIMGSRTKSLFGTTENGAQTLANIMFHIFGNTGLVLLAIIFTLACITTSVGLLTSCSQYFSKLFPKISYKVFIKIFTISSLILANMGLNKILLVSEPILNIIYPVALVLIILGILDGYINGEKIYYRNIVLFTGITSLLSTLVDLDLLKNNFLTMLVKNLPFYEVGLSWITPAVLAFILSYIIKKKNKIVWEN